MTALSARGLIKEFRGFRATNQVDLDVQEGEIHAIIGPNGAGKTTLFNLLSGHLHPNAGEVQLYGERISQLPPEAIVRKGLSRSFQISSVFGSLSVLDNLLVALQSRSNLPGQFWRSDEALRQYEGRARELIDLVDLTPLTDRPAADLSHGEKRHLEIALTLTQDPRVLLLDEPTSGMGSEGVARVIRLVRQVAQGRTVVLVEHNMSVVAELAHRITVLQYGSVLASGSYDEVRRNPKVIEAYLGEEVA
ncbi:ABC transporter ATP-binding protein [Deinococcus peraridilitoris]|uniref:ABC-type branched-chain amino acid transport systems, ATPase component n=1 Tax=Deinococcus peraridilitoris (strain DSM 19664 / LMG 22246 / CIP 109416 / KR-200) TaxID=937777 RepID=L0A0F1_DEIPD|nr:ABC transporter ATP-binding protein [Deinococcus peraridilitoris]AFZ66627.1 ABC-type branched-chain amino acid transport systems, ATPase component [Deinococcus peraridilitoris DSM 19664]